MMIAPPSLLQTSPVETIVRSSFLGACLLLTARAVHYIVEYPQRQHITILGYLRLTFASACQATPRKSVFILD